MAEITVIVHIKAKPGKAQALERELRAAIGPTHSEPGCLRFALHRSTSDKEAFLLVERWSSQQALDEHLKKPYLTHLLAQLKELAASSEASVHELLPEGSAAKLM